MIKSGQTSLQVQSQRETLNKLEPEVNLQTMIKEKNESSQENFYQPICKPLKKEKRAMRRLTYEHEQILTNEF